MMKESPFLYESALAGVHGMVHTYPNGTIVDADFIFLDGEPEAESLRALGEQYRRRILVCLTGAWETALLGAYPDVKRASRWLFYPAGTFRTEPAVLPEGYELRMFDEAAYDLHPFHHGTQYPTYEAFREYGSGAVVWHEGEIVASASSHITYRGEVELDFSTKKEHWGKGLGCACAAAMLRDCEARGLIVHWDAMNPTSAHIAEKFGFRLEREYYVYGIPEQTG